MGTRAMKQDIFILKAIEAKGYNIDDLTALSDKELDALPLPVKIIEGVKLYKGRGGKSATEIAEQIADLMMEAVDSDVEAVPEYVEQTQENQEVLEKITEESVVEVQKSDEPVVEIIHAEAKQEDVDAVIEVLKQKEFRSFASYMKLLKAEVPAAVLASIESTKISELIDARIAEVKADSK